MNLVPKQIWYKCAFLLISVGAVVTINAQDEDEYDPCKFGTKPESKKVLKLIKNSKNSKKYGPKERYKFLKDALAQDEECAYCAWQLAQSSYRTAKSKGSSFDIPRKYFKLVEEICPEYHADVYYNLGVMAYQEEDDKGALKYLQKFLDFPADDESKLSKNYGEQIQSVESTLPDIKFFVKFQENSVPFDPVLVKNVSSKKDEYLPMLSADNELLFYSRSYDKKEKGDLKYVNIEELTVSRRRQLSGPFDGGMKMKPPFNNGNFAKYGGVTISLDNKELYVCACKQDKGYYNCDLFLSRYKKVTNDLGEEHYQWSELEDLGPNINGKDTWEAQPSISADGKMLVFASSRPGVTGGTGKADLYFSERQEDGTWGPAENFGPPINSPGRDRSPFLHSDSKTLYFVSDCATDRLGAGKLDIFYSRMKDNGQWEKPKNIGQPINSSNDEDGLVVSTNGQYAYITSSRKGGAGGKDIYSFRLHKQAQPDKVKLIKGLVTMENEDEKKVVKPTKVEFRLESGEVYEQDLKIGEDGDYAAIVNLGNDDNKDVLMTIKQEGKVFESKLIEKEDKTPVVKGTAIQIRDVKIGEPYRINDILFETGSHVLTSRTKLILSGFVEYLKVNKEMKVAIHGHTDNQGKPDKNMELSERRAASVKEFIASQGVKASRLKSKGFGETKPKIPNTSSRNRAINRRTEFVITGN